MKFVDLSYGEHKTDEYLKVNPFGQYPAKKEEQFNLNESIAISRYLLQSCGSSSDFNPYEDAEKVS